MEGDRAASALREPVACSLALTPCMQVLRECIEKCEDLGIKVVELLEVSRLSTSGMNCESVLES